jgi:hypothetical protein
MKQQQKSAAQKGLRVAFDLSSDLPIGLSPDSEQLLTEEERSAAPSAAGSDIVLNEQGQQMQRFVLDGVEILVPLPSGTALQSVCGEDSEAFEGMPLLSSGKRK